MNKNIINITNCARKQLNKIIDNHTYILFHELPFKLWLYIILQEFIFKNRNEFINF